MGVNVKCQYCNNKIDRDEAFRHKSGTQNIYFCTQGHYYSWQQAKQIRDDVYNQINVIFERTVTNTNLRHEIDSLAEVYSYEVIYHYLCDNEENLTRYMRRQYDSEYAQIRYFAAILKNSLTDYTYAIPMYEKDIKPEYIEHNKFVRKKHRRALDDIEKEMG